MCSGQHQLSVPVPGPSSAPTGRPGKELGVRAGVSLTTGSEGEGSSN